MAGFNKFPTKTTDSGTTTITTSSVGAYPVLVADTTYQGPLSTNDGTTQSGQFMSGFVGDGDYIALPTSSSASMTYFDSTQTQVTTGSWSGGIGPANIVSAGVWVGVMLDATDSLLYVVARNGSTDVLQLASISVAGVITTIGSTLTLTTAFSTQPAWVGLSVSGASIIQREADGTGNIFVSAFALGVKTEEMEINISTGVEVTAVHVVGQNRATYKSASGIYVGGFDATAPSSDNGDIVMYFNSATRFTTMGLTYNLGVPASTIYLRPLQWGGRIVFAAIGGQIVIGPNAVTVAVFDAWIVAAALASGVA